MNIVFLSRRFYPYIGGVETHVECISRELVARGHKVTVITEGLLNQDHNGVELRNGIKIININPGSDDWFKKFRIWFILFRIRKIFNSADIIHCHDVFFWYLPFKIFNPQKKVYVTFHGYETKFPLSKKSIFIRKISEILSTGNICIGEYLKKWYGTNPDFVLYGGVQKSLNKTNAVNKSKTTNILFLGRLDNDIGVQVYIRAFALISESKIKYKLDILGDGKFRKQISKFGIAHGFVKDPTSFIKKSNIIFASSYLSMLQALINKKNVVAVYNSPLKEDYLKNSPFSRYVYICKNEKDIYKVTESIIKEPWKSKTMVENGYEWAINQTWTKVTDKYLDLWNI